MRNVCLNAIYELAKIDKRVVFIGSDLRLGTLNEMQEEFPDRFYMEGISEQNIIGMAAGLAMDGYIPYVNTIATFLTRRCYEQVALDICLHDLPVRLIANGGGLVYSALGATHMATEDISLMRHLPNMSVICPSDADEMKQLMPQTLDYPHPMYIRIGRGFVDPVIEYKQSFEIGKRRNARIGSEKTRTLIISTGLMTDIALKVADLLGNNDIDVEHVPTIKPFYTPGVSYRTDKIITIEEHSINGGLGSSVLEWLADYNWHIPVKRFGIPDRWLNTYGSWEDLLKECGLTPEQIVAQL